MNWIQSIKHQRSLSLFRKRSSKVKFPHEFVDFDHAKTFGFIINIGHINPDELVHFTKYITKLEEKGKKVIVIELNLRKKAEPMFGTSVNAMFIDTNQVNWLGFPSTDRLRKMNNAKFDILFNLDTSEEMTSRFICGLSNARMRVGVHEEETQNYYELMLQTGPESRLKPLLESFEMYSKMLHK